MDQKSKDQIAAEIASEYRATIRQTADEDQRSGKLRYRSVASKSLGIAYFLWAVFGTVGAHRFYLGHYPSATAMLVAAVLASLFAFLPALLVFSYPVVALLGIWWLLDAFVIPSMMPKDPPI